jgi:hypothetical protein
MCRVHSGNGQNGLAPNPDMLPAWALPNLVAPHSRQNKPEQYLNQQWSFPHLVSMLCGRCTAYEEEERALARTAYVSGHYRP